jgi:hypothetical protein
MTIVTINVADATNPVEVQTWLDANPTASLFDVAVNGSLFYIFYQ